MSHSLTLSNFLLALEKENDWRTLGIFMEVEECVLDEIEHLYESKGIRRCKEELFKGLKRKAKCPTWEEITEALDNMRNHALAMEIRDNYCSKTLAIIPTPDLSINSDSTDVTPSRHHESVDDTKMHFVKEKTVRELESLRSKFSKLVDDIRRQLNINKVTVQSLRTYSQVYLQLEMPSEFTTINKYFETLIPHFCFIQYYCLEDLVTSFLGDCKSIKAAFENYKKELVKFKKSAPIKSLCNQISLEMSRGTRIVELKLMGFWSNVTVERFEKLVISHSKTRNSSW